MNKERAFELVREGFVWKEGQPPTHQYTLSLPRILHASDVRTLLLAVKEHQRKQKQEGIFTITIKPEWLFNDKWFKGLNVCQDISLVHLQKLNALDISRFNSGDKGCRQLWEVQWQWLSKLNLTNNNIKLLQGFSHGKWHHLETLQLYYNDIGTQGCKELTLADMSRLLTLNLGYNLIDWKGCELLSKASWPNLKSINLQSNQINDNGCQLLSQAPWRLLECLNLSYNKIANEGCKYLANGPWKGIQQLSILKSTNNSHLQINQQGYIAFLETPWEKLSVLNIQWNRNNASQVLAKLPKTQWRHSITILDLCYINTCQQEFIPLLQVKWSNIQQILLSNSNFGEKACKWLIRAELNNLKLLSLSKIPLQTETFGKMLSKAQWKHLNQLDLYHTHMRDRCCRHLVKANWPSLSQVFLKSTNYPLTEKGCEYLSKGEWSELTTLSIDPVMIKRRGYNYLSRYYKQMDFDEEELQLLGGLDQSI